MKNRTNARLTAAALMIVFVSAVAVLLARQLNVAPMRPEPAYRTFGPADAPIQIYEFTDFSCPFCRMAHTKLDELMKLYPGKIRLVFKHYPLLGIHPWSLYAAAYADCAGEQGKFKQYADLLFDNQETWAFEKGEPGEFREYALKLGLDWDKMQSCAGSTETLRALKLDMSEAEMKNVDSTPTFFINGKRAVGAGQLLDAAKNFDNIIAKAGKP
jgi:protein-disulfide isomerase